MNTHKSHTDPDTTVTEALRRVFSRHNQRFTTLQLVNLVEIELGKRVPNISRSLSQMIVNGDVIEDVTVKQQTKGRTAILTMPTYQWWSARPIYLDEPVIFPPIPELITND